MIKLTWGAYLARIGGELAVVPTMEDVPVCETCHNGLSSRWRLCDCPACAGTGRAWHWHIQPAAGMLCDLWPNGVGQPHPFSIGGWRIIHGVVVDPPDWKSGTYIRFTENYVLRHVSEVMPLAPPPGCGLMLEEALACLPGARGYGPIATISHNADQRAVAESVYNTGHFTIQVHANSYTDLAPLEHAIQHHKALQAYIAGWEAQHD